MSAAKVSKWSRRFVLASAVFLVLWQASQLVAVPRRTSVVLGVYGFVLHMVFGKAYALIPSYFDRDLTATWAPPAQFPLTTVGTVFLLLEPLQGIPPFVGTVGSLLWALGVGLFLGTILWTIRDNLSGQETGTSDANRSRRWVDRISNAFMPVALGYLAIGSYETIALHTALPLLFDGYFPRISHLLAAGTATLLVFAIGFRLLPRFLVATPPRGFLLLVLPTGSLGPILLAAGLGGGWLFQVGAVLEAVAVLAFAATFAVLFVRSDRRRVGFYGVLGGVVSGCVAVSLGLIFAFDHATSGLVAAHYRLNVLGFLGLTIVGIAYQFYPPSVGTFAGASDRTAVASISGLAGGLFLEAFGLSFDDGMMAVLGQWIGVLGALVYLYLLVGLFHERYH